MNANSIEQLVAEMSMIQATIRQLQDQIEWADTYQKTKLSEAYVAGIAELERQRNYLAYRIVIQQHVI